MCLCVFQLGQLTCAFCLVPAFQPSRSSLQNFSQFKNLKRPDQPLHPKVHCGFIYATVFLYSATSSVPHYLSVSPSAVIPELWEESVRKVFHLGLNNLTSCGLCVNHHLPQEASLVKAERCTMPSPAEHFTSSYTRCSPFPSLYCG